MFVRNIFKIDTLLNSNLEMNWILAVKLNDGKRKAIVGGIYHSPSASNLRFMDILENHWLNEIVEDEIDNIFCGDFNINFNKEAECRELKRVMEACGFRQIVTENTRITVSSSTRIDLVFTNVDRAEATIISDYRVSDHESINIYAGFGLDDVEPDTLQIVNDWSRYNSNVLRQLLEEGLPTLRCADFNELVRRIDLLLKNSVNALVGLKSVRKKLALNGTGSGTNWYSRELRATKKQRDKLYRQFLRTKSEQSWRNYTVMRNEYSRKIKEAKNQSIQDELERNKYNGKQLWKSIKRLISSNGTKTGSISFNGVEIANESKIAEKFNDFFIDSVIDIHDSIPAGSNGCLDQIIYNGGDFRTFEAISSQEFDEIINNMKPTAGIENVSLRVFKDSLPVLGNPLRDIINTSLQSGRIPETWKCSTVVPIEKQNKARDATLYRPINMMEIQEKVLELAVKRQFLGFIEDEEILIAEQSGFRKQHSTESAVNLVLRNWKINIENGNYTVAVFLDFKRAFETIDREILIDVLTRIGISGTVLNWFKDYLGNRMQRTKFGSSYSRYRENNLGVPQGSVLGPLLFILYINDMKKCLQYGRLKLFADDSVSYWSGKDLEHVIQEANADLKNIANFLKHRKLCLNLNKTSWMIIGNRKIGVCSNLYIDGCAIERVRQVKYLGVQIDEKLNFVAHIDYTIKKIAMKYGVLCRISRYMTFWSKIIYVKSVITPHFDYCATILLHASDTQTKRLQRIQNKIMRVIIRCNRYTPSAFMLDMLQWLSVKQRITYNSLIFIFKMKKGMLPTYLLDGLQYGIDIHRYSTRRAQDFRLPNTKKEMSKRSIFYNGLKMYNDLPMNIKDSSNLNVFKKLTIQYVKQTI